MKIVRIYKPKESIGDVIAFFDIETDEFRINGFSLRKDTSGFRLAVPSKKDKNNKWWPIVIPITAETKRRIKECLCELLKNVRHGNTNLNDVKTVDNKWPNYHPSPEKIRSQEDLRDTATENATFLLRLGEISKSEIKDFIDRANDGSSE